MSRGSTSHPTKYSSMGQLVESPQQFILQPMLINTKNPKGPGPGRGDPALAAPVPKASLINKWPKDYACAAAAAASSLGTCL